MGFKEHEMFPVPGDVPELGVKAGFPAVIASVHKDGRLLSEIARDEGSSTGFVGVCLDGDTPRVVGYSYF